MEYNETLPRGQAGRGVWGKPQRYSSADDTSPEFSLPSTKRKGRLRQRRGREAVAGDVELKTFKDGYLLVGGIWVIQLKDQKSPGESALFIQQGKGVLILGDALIGKPAGALSMLPAEKYADREKAKDGLRRLLKYEFDSVLVGDGASIMTGAKPFLEQALQ